MKVIAKAYTEFPEKFGVPRQSGLAQNLYGKIVFEPEFQNPDALRGIEEYSHLWLIWGFSRLEMRKNEWSPTVRPPRLGGNKRVGVFATRSPFRPNPIGLSCVKLEAVDYEEEHGLVLKVSGLDLVDETPIYDIKPYLPYVDSHPNARGGFSTEAAQYSLDVYVPAEFEGILDTDKLETLISVLKQDPRPSYQNDPTRIYGMKFAGHNIKFRVEKETVIVEGIIPIR